MIIAPAPRYKKIIASAAVLLVISLALAFCVMQAFQPAFTTDNAAMVAIVGYFKYLRHDFCAIDEPPFARVEI